MQENEHPSQNKGQKEKTLGDTNKLIAMEGKLTPMASIQKEAKF